jgi:hypothetical protein
MAPNWKRVVYAETQPEYTPLPSLQEVQPTDDSTRSALRTAAAHVLRDPNAGVEVQLLARWVQMDMAKRSDVQRVVSVWEPDDTETVLLLEWAKAVLRGDGGRAPHISLMLHTFGQPLQPIRLMVGHFTEPYTIQPLDVVDDRATAERQQFSVKADNAAAIPWRQDAPPGPPDPPRTKHRPVG